MTARETQLTPLSPGWEKAKVLSTVFATIFIPIALAIIAQLYAVAQQDRAISAKYVELAVGILSSKPAPETHALRQWAIETINHYSAVALTQEAQDELKLQSLAVEMQATLQSRQRALDSVSRAAKKAHDRSLTPIPELR